MSVGVDPFAGPLADLFSQFAIFRQLSDSVG